MTFVALHRMCAPTLLGPHICPINRLGEFVYQTVTTCSVRLERSSLPGRVDSRPEGLAPDAPGCMNAHFVTAACRV